jgi:hypothetical protein
VEGERKEEEKRGNQNVKKNGYHEACKNEEAL